MKRCIYCGHENEDAAQTCAMCGNRLVDVPEDGTAPIEEIPDEDFVPAGVDDSEISNITIAEAEPDEHIDVEADQSEESPAAPAEDDGEVKRGQTYAAQQQYADADAQPYGGQDYSYEAQEEASSQYGGQAYGYDHSPETVGEPGEAYGSDEDYASEIIMEKSRRRVHSFLFFIAALLYSVKTIAGIVNCAASYLPEPLKEMGMHFSTYENTLRNWFGENEALDMLHRGIEWIGGVDPKIVLGVLLAGFIRGIFIMFGFWTAFSGIHPDEDEVRTSGLTMIRVWEILKMIVICLVLAAGIVFAVAYVVAAGAASSPMALIVGIVALLVVVIFSVLTIMYYVQLIFSVRMVRRNVRKGDDIGRMPGYLIFAGFVLLALTVLLILPMDPSEIIGLIYLGATAVFLLFILIWAIVYRATVKVR